VKCEERGVLEFGNSQSCLSLEREILKERDWRVTTRGRGDGGGRGGGVGVGCCFEN
jgi:hypothetical protein